MIRIIIWAIVAYCLYKLVFDFLIPVFRVTRRMKRQVREFQRQANGQFENYQKDNIRPGQEPPAQKEGEYIDFEEIKEK
jgi:uridine kinase